MQLTERHHRYWEKTLSLTRLLLIVWFAVTFVVGYFARSLDFALFGWPFSFWVAGQGALVVFVLIIGYYAYAMNRLDNQFGVAETEEE